MVIMVTVIPGATLPVVGITVAPVLVENMAQARISVLLDRKQ